MNTSNQEIENIGNKFFIKYHLEITIQKTWNDHLKQIRLRKKINNLDKLILEME